MDTKKAFLWVPFSLLIVANIVFFGYQLYKDSESINLVSVRVLDSDGRPIAGVFVTMQRTKAKKDKEQPLISAITDQRGIAQYLDVPPGQYDIRLPNITCLGEIMGINADLQKYYRDVHFDFILDNNCTRRVVITPR